MKMHSKLVTIALVSVLIIVLIGTIVCYTGLVNDKNSQIESMNSQIASLNSQISNLKNQVANFYEQVTNLTTANLVTALGTNQVTWDGLANPSPHNHLYIQGSVTNVGKGTAYNAGLHVIAYDSKGNLEINMTVPLVNIASFGTDSNTIAYALKQYRGTTSLQLGSLLTTQTVDIQVQIFHEGNVTQWDVTPVWTNNP